MTVFNLTAIPNATFDDATRQLTIDCSQAAYTGHIPATPTNEEQIEVGLIKAVEAQASGKRTDLNVSISDGDELSLPATPQQFVLRENADASSSEEQIEYTPNLRLWFVSSGSADASNAVNDND